MPNSKSDTYVLDTCGARCPLPTLKAKQQLAKMTRGQQLRVLATDPGTVDDFPAFTKLSGDNLLDSCLDWDKPQFEYLIEKA